MTVTAANTPRRRYHAVILVMLACSILCALGAWQVQRLSWKQDLIVTLEQRLSAAPVDMRALATPYGDHEWSRVSVAGRFENDGTVMVAPRTHDGQVGVHVFTPLSLDSGTRVMVNRGFVSNTNVGAVTTPQGVVTITGVLRKAVRGGRFTPDNNPAANQWYWPDAAAMLGDAGGIADVYVQAGAGADGDMIVPVTVTPDLPNNHAQYAAFWFGMAGLCLLIFVLARKKGYA